MRIRLMRLIQPRSSGRLPLLAAAAMLLLGAASAAEALTATVLTHDLGDPRIPGNLKLAVTIPDAMHRRRLAAAARDFSVYVYPEDLSEEEGTDAAHLAKGVYLWRGGSNLFLDVRVVPPRDADGRSRVKVVYHPDGKVEAEGVADGVVTYMTQAVDVVLAVDISSSMNHTDPGRRRVAAAESFIEMARRGGGIDRVGLVVFNARARQATPLLPLADGEILLDALGRVGADGMTSLDAPLRMGMEALAEDADSRRPVVILLTDGRNEGSRYRDTHLELAERGIRIFTVGLTEMADHELLKEMADATGGMYFRAPTDEDLPEIYARLAAELGKRRLLRSDPLRAERGRVDMPIDSSVKRLVALADGGARVGISRPDGRGTHAGGAMSQAHLVNPEPGLWEFSWENAAPDVSVMSLFGDTQFFLDVFPPQLRGARLSLGATLAEGANPLAGARVWAEPIPGVIDQPVEMFDDGRHGDGDGGDGVYGAAVDFPRDDVERLDMTFRASGAAWDKGDFARQASAQALRSREPPGGGTAGLDGDIDFGTLFPGETGTAVARVDLDARGPRELDFDLGWNADENEWPGMSSRVLVRPGRRAFQLEMTVPESVRPGEYTGRFSISDGDELGDDGVARVRVGDVRFTRPPFIDLGVVPPGTFSANGLRLPYDADKEADFRFEFDGDGDLRVASDATRLSAGKGEIAMEAVVTVPMGKPEGEYSGMVRLFAGPARAEIPLRWRVKSYAVAGQDEIAPVTGVPELPEFPGAGEMAALPEPPPMDGLFPSPGEAEREPISSAFGPSPWEKAAEAIRDGPVEPPPPAAPTDFIHTAADSPEASSGDGVWSAWWVYLLAILLLLMLLLLLVAYILYRLGKSELARLLLVSGLANLLLLFAFVALLGTSAGETRASPPVVTVNLVGDDYQPASEYYTDLEKDLLAAPSPAPQSEAQAEDAASASASDGMASLERLSESDGLVSERQAESASEARNETQLAMARNPAAVSMENSVPEAMNRRDRQTDRASLPTPEPSLPDADAPPADAAETDGKAAQSAGVGEIALDLDANMDTDRPVWSDGERSSRPETVRKVRFPAEDIDMEAVDMAAAAASMAPQSSRRAARDASDMYPEPRVEIADPARDKEETADPDAPANRDARPGVEEIRSELPSMNTRLAEARPGAAAPPSGASSLDDQNRNIARSDSGGASGGGSEPSLAPGGLRSRQPGSGRAGAAFPNPAGGIPGGLSANAAPNREKDAGGAGNAGTGVDAGEKRFDEVGDAGGESGFPSPRSGGDAGGPNPSRLGGGESGRGDDDTVAFAPAAGGGDDGAARNPGSRNGGDGHAPRRRQGAGRGAADEQPRGLDGPPGSGDDRGDGQGGAGTERGSGAGGVDEGRFDVLPGSGGGPGLARRGGAASSGMTGSILDDGVSGVGLGAVSLPQDDENWFVERRRETRRLATAASSSLEIDSLLIVVGDFARLPDPAAENLFSALANRIGGGMTVEERRLTPDDANLSDTLLAVLTPEETRDWSEADIAKAGAYLAGGGHIWMDYSDPGEADDFMRGLAKAAGGAYGPLPAPHPLAEFDAVSAIAIGGKTAAVSTAQNWRRAWRYDRDGGDDGRAMRFLIRGLNYFLSGNAESGIVLDPGELRGDLYVEPHSERIPDSLSSGKAPEGTVWDSFEPASAGAWRMPAWSDPGEVSVISDGQGGRALKLDLAAAAKGRSAVYRILSPQQDFSRANRLSLDVYHDGSGQAAVSLVLTVPASAGWTDYETRPARLGPGWNRVEFDLAEPVFRALSGGSSFSSPLSDASRTGRVGFFLYRDGPSSAIAMFRDIRLHER